MEMMDRIKDIETDIMQLILAQYGLTIVFHLMSYLSCFSLRSLPTSEFFILQIGVFSVTETIFLSQTELFTIQLELHVLPTQIGML